MVYIYPSLSDVALETLKANFNRLISYHELPIRLWSVRTYACLLISQKFTHFFKKHWTQNNFLDLNEILLELQI